MQQPMHSIPARGGLNYDETPFLAIWEVTQSCDLACKHCRAAAQPIAHPEQLSTAEGKGLIEGREEDPAHLPAGRQPRRVYRITDAGRAKIIPTVPPARLV